MPAPSEVRPDAEFGTRLLTVGKRYTVKMSDCCIEGQFTGTYLGVRYTEDAPRSGVLDFPYVAVFDVGEIGPDWGAWSVTEA